MIHAISLFSLWLVVVVGLYFARKTQRAHEVVLIEFMRFEWRLEKKVPDLLTLPR